MDNDNVINGLLNVLRAIGLKESTPGESGLPRVKINSTATGKTQVEVVGYAVDSTPEALAAASKSVRDLYDELATAYGVFDVPIKK